MQLLTNSSHLFIYSIALTKVCPGISCGGFPLCPYLLTRPQGEIRIVQASLLGSILANLLLILGMSFLLGGLRYREQVSMPFVCRETCFRGADSWKIYNSTVTQMSACLLSLSVISLVLPVSCMLRWLVSQLTQCRRLFTPHSATPKTRTSSR